jgi:glycosyltransferase involved in cell wall biosynthesis
MPLVSVGMPVYNGERWLRQTIESILSQTLDDFVLEISDNASSDATQAICREYAEKDRRVRYHRNPENIGLNGNWTLAFRRTKSKYFKWASCNDLCAPRFLERCVERLEASPNAVLCHTQTRIIHGGDDTVGEPYADDVCCDDADAYTRLRHTLERIRLNNAINGVIRSDVLAQTGLIADYFSSDVVLLVELALHGPILQVPEELFFRRMAPGAATQLKSGAEIASYYQPKGDRKMRFQHWKLHYGYLGAAARAPLSLTERRRVYTHLLRRVIWSRVELLSDVKDAMRASAAAG